MPSFGTDSKFSVRYSVVTPNEESSSRMISGLNPSSSNPATGPSGVNAVASLLNAVNSLSSGSVTNARWISERDVIL